MTKVSEEHFYRQFDRFEAGEQRTQAACRQAAYLLQRLYDEERMQRTQLEEILQLLTDGHNVKAALLIKDILDQMYA
jgi:septal ring factor EnvC (AmiA/AmiB activator)